MIRLSRALLPSSKETPAIVAASATSKSSAISSYYSVAVLAANSACYIYSCCHRSSPVVEGCEKYEDLGFNTKMERHWRLVVFSFLVTVYSVPDGVLRPPAQQR